jgi:hypothetical protein
MLHQEVFDVLNWSFSIAEEFIRIISEINNEKIK